MKLSLLKYYISFLLILQGVSSLAQSFDFKTFDSSVGLPQNFVYTIAQDNSGFLWIGTGEGLVRFDGREFKTFTTKDSLPDDFIKNLYVSKKGVLWIGHNNGSITHRNEGIFNSFRIDDGPNSPINDITEDDNNTIWYIAQNNGLISINQDNEPTLFFNQDLFAGILFYSIEFIGNNRFLVGTSQGLYLLSVKGKEIKSFDLIDVIPQTQINKIIPKKNSTNEFWIATEDEGFFKFSIKDNIAEHVADQKLCLIFNLNNESIQDIFEDNNGDLLIATWGKGVIRLFYNPTTKSFNESLNFSVENGLNNNYIKAILNDNENNIWFASYGSGVCALFNSYFVFYKLENIGFKQNKVYAALNENGSLWLGLENGLLKIDPLCFMNHEFYDIALGIPNDIITSFVEEPETGIIWAASQNKGLYKRMPGKLKFEKYNYTESLLGNQINDLKWYNGKLLLATAGGFYILDLKTKNVKTFTTENNLPHNYINFVYVDKQNKIWIGPKNSGVCQLNDNDIEVHKISTTPVNVSGMTEDLQGNRWLATIGKGIIKYSSDSIENITVNEGLAKNYCYSIICDKTNKLFVCHWPGVSCIDLNSGHIRTFKNETSLNSDFYRLSEDKNKNIWFSSAEGAICYFPDKDVVNATPPAINFTSITISGKKYHIGESINLDYPYNTKYKFRFDFIGISFKNPSEVTYKLQLNKEGDEDGEWLDIGTTNVREYEFLPDGDYVLTIKAINSDGIESEQALTQYIHINTPFWKKWWFFLLSAITLISIVYFTIKYREQKLNMQKRLLEKEVASQTVVLRQQKAEIEKKNRDITDSINYAKRIQSSILPSQTELHDVFPESFIFFAPRDIVSGDFYWFKKINNRFLICIADCTGHGVPGAFMSMIGTTLLNDLANRNELKNPAELLEVLDVELKDLLKNESHVQSQDGMDIAIIDFNLETSELLVSTAKRPVYIYTNNEIIENKSTRRSIGEASDNQIPFELTSYTLNKGDKIYLFSDGYTDQFGGDKGKKIMKNGVEKILSTIVSEPMMRQGEIIESKFLTWKGDLEQIDDVIFMGVMI